ncbi:MAG: DUF4340 domain-containing protein [Candidatus Hydrogenedens sp.]|nr:DUF4340 domain-containing protein [Candidatus Hydrogenedens sp.]
MNWRVTLGLFVAFVVLTGAYFGMQYQRVVDVVEQQQAKQLFTFKPDAVTRISIERIGEAASVAEREPGGAWKMVEPNATIAPFPMMWDRVAHNLAGLLQQRDIDLAGLNLADYGLDVPALTFEATAGDEAIDLKFGSLEPTQENRYALLNDDRLLLIHKDQFFELNRPLDDLRNRFTVDDRDATIVRFEFAHIWTGRGDETLENPPAVGEESTPIIAVRDSADDVWRLEEPWQTMANQDVVDGIVKELQFAVGRNFVDNPEDLSDYGLKPASFRVTLTDNQDGKAQTFLFGFITEENGGVFVQRPDREGVFVIDAQVITLIPKSPLDFQERRLLTRQALEFNQIEISGPTESFSITDAGGGWKVENDPGFITDYNAVSAYIGTLKNARGDEYLEGEPAQYGLDAPEWRLVLHPKTGGAPAEILLKPHPDDPEKYYAKQDQGPVYEIAKSVVEPLMVSHAHFRSRFLMRFLPAKANGLRFAFEGQDYAFKKAHGLWVVEQPAGKALSSQGEMERIIDALSKLTAPHAEPETAAPESGYGLDAPVLTLEADVEGDDGKISTTGPLQVGAITADAPLERYAQIAGRDGVYRVRQKLIDDVREFLRAIVDKQATAQ